MVKRQEKTKQETKDAFTDHIISVRRVTKVTKGGKRFTFSAFVVSGDKKGNVGIGLGKSKEASGAIAKATSQARKNFIQIAKRGTTIPYRVEGKQGASHVVIRPASKGTGNIAGGAVRAILDAAGIEDALTKSIGAGTGINVAKATLNALAKLRSAQRLAHMRGMTVEQMVKGAS